MVKRDEQSALIPFISDRPKMIPSGMRPARTLRCTQGVRQRMAHDDRLNRRLPQLDTMLAFPIG